MSYDFKFEEVYRKAIANRLEIKYPHKVIITFGKKESMTREFMQFPELIHGLNEAWRDLKEVGVIELRPRVSFVIDYSGAFSQLDVSPPRSMAGEV